MKIAALALITIVAANQYDCIPLRLLALEQLSAFETEQLVVEKKPLLENAIKTLQKVVDVRGMGKK